MIKSDEIKKIILELGADICGIASIDRFDQAPEGFHPTDLYAGTKSVIVFAKKIPESIFHVKSCIPYSFIDDIALHETLRLSLEISVKLENFKIRAIPIPSEPYEYWDEASMTGKGMLSLKHAGYLAGLGVIGRNQLLNNPNFGNLIKLGAVLTNAVLEPDPILSHNFCADTCNLCIDNCPSGALNKESVQQKNCREYSEGSTKKGVPITICNKCRSICPYRSGWKKQTNKLESK
ncbi:MAG: epoxyqueuosine reductase [Prolixibacteraceae bacterium]|nr:epoxyqueuosine reductase [Prolixibacteraceae bacterium]